MDLPMLLVFLASLAGFTGLYFWLYKVQVSLENLLCEQTVREELR